MIETEPSLLYQLSDTSDETVEAAVLAASEAGVVIESDATVP